MYNKFVLIIYKLVKILATLLVPTATSKTFFCDIETYKTRKTIG